MKLILENWQGFLNESQAAESANVKFQPLLQALKNAKSIDEFESEIITPIKNQASQRQSYQTFDNIIGQPIGDQQLGKEVNTIYAEIMNMINGKPHGITDETLAKLKQAGSQPKQNPEETKKTIVDAGKAVATSKDPQKELETKTAEVSQKTGIGPKRSKAAITQVANQAAQQQAGQSKEVDKYKNQVAKLFPDETKQQVILKFLTFLSQEGLLNESKSKGPIKNKIAEYLGTLTPEDKKAFLAILQDNEDYPKFREFIKSVYKSEPKTSSEESDGGDDANIVDPDSDKMKELVSKFNAFKDEFYQKKKLRLQAILVNDLLKALNNFNEEEEEEAFKRTEKPEEKEETATEVNEAAESEIPAKPKDIKNFKASVRSFQRALRVSIDLIKKADTDTKGGKLVGHSTRAEVVKFATETQKRIGMLNDSITSIMAPLERATLDEKLSADVQKKMNQYRETLEKVEKVYETVSGNDEEQGGLGDIIEKLASKTEMTYAQIQAPVKKALELLSTIKKYFPSILPYEGSKIESTQIVDEYKKAIQRLDLDASDIQTLNDAFDGTQGKNVILNFQNKLIVFSKDIERIFGIPGLENKDSIDPTATPDETGTPEEREAETPTPETYIDYVDDVLDIGDDEIFDGLVGDSKRRLKAFIGFLMYDPEKAKGSLEESEDIETEITIDSALGKYKSKFDNMPDNIKNYGLKVIENNKLYPLLKRILGEKGPEAESTTPEPVKWSSPKDIQKWFQTKIFTPHRALFRATIAPEIRGAATEEEESPDILQRQIMLLIVGIIAFKEQSTLRAEQEPVMEFIGRFSAAAKAKKQLQTLQPQTKRALRIFGFDQSAQVTFIKKFRKLKLDTIKWLDEWFQSGDKRAKFRLLRAILETLKGFKFETKSLKRGTIKKLEPYESEKADKAAKEKEQSKEQRVKAKQAALAKPEEFAQRVFAKVDSNKGFGPADENGRKFAQKLLIAFVDAGLLSPTDFPAPSEGDTAETVDETVKPLTEEFTLTDADAEEDTFTALRALFQPKAVGIFEETLNKFFEKESNLDIEKRRLMYKDVARFLFTNKDMFYDFIKPSLGGKIKKFFSRFKKKKQESLESRLAEKIKPLIEQIMRGE